MFDITDIVDPTPGSGALARVALSRGNKYVGAVADAKHLAWLQNTMDTASLRYIAKEGPLYMADVAELITEHYQELIEGPSEDAEEEDFFSEDDM